MAVSSPTTPTQPRTFDNPSTGERIVIRMSGADTAGELLVFDLFLPPRGHVPAQHAHPTQEERFTVVDGVLRFRVGRRTIVAAAGDTVRIPPRTVHWFGNPGPSPALAMVEVRPALRMEELLEASAMLSHSGRFAGWHVPRPAALAHLLLEFQAELAVPFVPRSIIRIVLRAIAGMAGERPVPSREELVIRARALGRAFGRSVAVEDVSLDVADGTILALLGPNGAGKTTTVRMLAGLLAPTDGEAEVAGYDVRRQPADVRSRVGLVTDTPGLHDQMTPDAYLDFFGQVYGVPASVRRSRIADMLTLFDLDHVASRRMATFSRGMQQKVALARALLHEPSVVFLDEPTAGLDPLAARTVRDLIVGLKHASRAIVLCTHDLDEAERLADTVAILRRGRVVACDTPGALRAAASRSSLVHVRLAHADPVWIDRVRRLEGVLDPRLDVSLAGGGVLTYRTVDAEGVNPDVIASLVGVGARIVSVTHDTASLEDVFTRAVTGEPAA